METFDLIKHVDWELTQDIRKEKSMLCSFAGSVGEEVKKITIKHSFETRPHKFTCGTDGQVAKKLVIEIDFNEANIQPHQHFEDDFCVAITEALAENVNGLFENS